MEPRHKPTDYAAVRIDDCVLMLADAAPPDWPSPT